MTLENIIVRNDQLYFIDFLDSFYDSWFLDVGTLLQDVQVMWSYRFQNDVSMNTVLRLIVFRDLLLEEIRKIDPSYVVEIYYALLQKLIRIYPYTKNELTYNFLNEKTRIVLKNIKTIEDNSGGCVMSTLIVPCLGRRIVNELPQYLHRHPQGKLLIEHSIEGIFSKEYEKILIVLLKEDIEKYHADTLIKEELKKYPVEIIILKNMTSGPAETVYMAIQKANITGPVVVKDVDNYLKIADVPQGNFVAGLDLNTWERDIHNLRNKSFLILNEARKFVRYY